MSQCQMSRLSSDQISVSVCSGGRESLWNNVDSSNSIIDHSIDGLVFICTAPRTQKMGIRVCDYKLKT